MHLKEKDGMAAVDSGMRWKVGISPALQSFPPCPKLDYDPNSGHTIEGPPSMHAAMRLIKGGS